MLILSQVDSLTAFHSKHSSFCFQNSMQTYTQLYKSLLPAWDRHCISPLAYTARTCLLVSAFLCVPPTCNIFHTEQAARKTLLNVSQIMASQSFHLSPHSALNKNQTLHRGSHSPPPHHCISLLPLFLPSTLFSPWDPTILHPFASTTTLSAPFSPPKGSCGSPARHGSPWLFLEPEP